MKAAARARRATVLIVVVALVGLIAGCDSDVPKTNGTTVKADLVVVGNRGMSGMKRFILGSVPNKIAHHAPCSVLIVDTST